MKTRKIKIHLVYLLLPNHRQLGGMGFHNMISWNPDEAQLTKQCMMSTIYSEVR